MGWSHLKLGKVLKLEYGKPLPQERRTDNGQFPAYGANGVKCHTNDVYWEKPSIIVGRKGSAGEVNLVDGGFWPLDVTYFVVFNDSEYDLRFLFYLLSWLNLPSLAKGVKPGLNRNDVYEIDQWFPPLPEQERIVSILDETFAAIATATHNAEKNLANERELYDTFLIARFISHAQKWPRRTLAELLELGWIIHHMDGNHGGDYPRKHEFIEKGVPYISANSIADDRIDMGKAKYLSPERAACLRKGFAHDGDVLFAHNATVGPVTILNTSCETVILGTSLTYYRCDPEFIYPQYLAHYMRSSEFVRQYKLVMRQSTRNQVPITKQREFTHIIPPIEDQLAIASTLDEVRSRMHALERSSYAKLALLSELKQSILKKVFTGELAANPIATGKVIKEAGI